LLCVFRNSLTALDRLARGSAVLGRDDNKGVIPPDLSACQAASAPAEQPLDIGALNLFLTRCRDGRPPVDPLPPFFGDTGPRVTELPG
jgi:hypothetical protein